MNTKHLKAKILDLAIRGKLVTQDSSEGNAADLLQKIREEKSELIKQKKIKEDKNTSFVIKADDGKHYEQFTDGTLKDIEDEIPFEIPENWCWCRLGMVSKIITKGSSPSWQNVKYVESGILFITSENIRVENIDLRKKKFLESKFNTIQNRSILEKGDILTNIVGASIGRSAIFNLDVCDANINQAVAVIKLIQNGLNKYLIKLLNSSFIMNQMNSNTVETARANISLDTVYNFLLPLPPLSEQQRIVSAIEKAFEQIDIIEKNKLNLKTYIKQTKSKVLDLAIHGKLVEQNPQEGNAFELLEKIRNEKAELIKQKKIKEDKNASFIIKADDGKHYEQFADGSLKDVEEEIPFEIPENWCWCRLTSICDYGKCKNAAPSELLPDSWILDLEDIEKRTGKIKKFVNFSERNSLSTKHVFTKGDILYSKLRPYLNKVVIAPKDGFCTSEILPLDFNGVYINNFAQRLLMSPYFLSTVNMLTYGVKMPRLGTDEANQILLPLPPLSEQKRIVAKIDQVFEQLDVLEKSMGE